MNQSHVRTLIAAGVVEDVVALRVDAGWECWVYGASVPAELGNRVRHARGAGEVRTWAKLDTLVRWIREQGWRHRIGVEG